MDKFWAETQDEVRKTLFAYFDNKIISTLSLGIFNGIALTDQVKNLYSENGTISGSLLTWHGIKWAKENGFRIYDMSGGFADNLNDSLLFYKEKWGTTKLPYYKIKKVRAKLRYRIFSILYKLMISILEKRTKTKSVYRI